MYANNGLNGNGSHAAKPPNVTRARWSDHEKQRFRQLLREGATNAILLAEIRKTRPWMTEAGLGATKARYGKRLGAGKAPVAEKAVAITIKAPGSDAVTFQASKTTARAVVELLVGV